MPHTRKHFVLMLNDGVCEYSIFFSGGALYTVETKCITSEMTEKNSFVGFTRARKWISERIDYHAMCFLENLPPG